MGGHIGLVDLARLLWRRRAVLIATAIVFTLSATLAAFLLPKQYTAVAEILIEGQDPQVLSVTNVLRTPPQDRPSMATNVQLLSARSFLRRVIDSFNLMEDPEFNPTLPGGPRVWDRVQDTVARIVAALPPQVADIVASEPASPNQQKERTISQLADETQVEQTGEAYTIAIRVTSFDPEKAAMIANGMAERFMQERLEAKRAVIAGAAEWLNERLAELRVQVSESEGAVADFRRQQGVPAARDDNPLMRQMEQITNQLVLAEGRRAQAEARLAQVGSREEMAPSMFSSPMLIDLQQQEAAFAREAAQLAETFGPRHPRMTDINAQLQNVQEREAEERRRIVDDLRQEVLVARAEEEQLREHLGSIEADIQSQQSNVMPVLELERQAEADRAIYTTFLSRLKEVSEQFDIAESGVHLASAASPPGRASFPQPTLMITGGLASSLIVGIVLALMVELFDTGLRTARQVETTLGVPTIGMIPRVSRRRRGKQSLREYLLANPRSSFNVALRGLKLELLQSDLDRPPKVVLITSALPREGKTTLAACLASVAAEDGMNTALIDLDLHRPRIRSLFQVSSGTPGVVEYLTGECGLDDALVPDKRFAKLHTLSAHRTSANPSALFVTQRAADFVQTLRNRFDLTLIDSPPTLAVGDARALADLVDATLFVVRWGKTPAAAAEAGLETLRDIRRPLVGVALTQVNVRQHARRVYGDALQYHRRVAGYYQG